MRERVRSEVTAIGDECTYDAVSKLLPYTEQCLLEVLRLYPPVPFLMRSAKQDTQLTLADGRKLDIPKHTRLSPHVYACHRLERFFGKDAMEFKPERWTDGISTFPPHIFMSFNLAPRLCLGRHFAILEAKIFLVKFLQAFDYKLCPESEGKPVIPTGVLLAMKNGLHVEITEK
jgi:midchain alkane hydroxylase